MVDSQQVQQVLILSKVSRLALGGTQPPTQWVREASLWAVKRPERKDDHFPSSREKAASCGDLVGTSVTKCQRSRSFRIFINFGICASFSFVRIRSVKAMFHQILQAFLPLLRYLLTDLGSKCPRNSDEHEFRENLCSEIHIYLRA